MTVQVLDNDFVESLLPMINDSIRIIQIFMENDINPVKTGYELRIINDTIDAINECEISQLSSHLKTKLVTYVEILQECKDHFYEL